MTVNEAFEKLAKLKLEGYGDHRLRFERVFHQSPEDSDHYAVEYENVENFLLREIDVLVK